MGIYEIFRDFVDYITGRKIAEENKYLEIENKRLENIIIEKGKRLEMQKSILSELGADNSKGIDYTKIDNYRKV